MDERVVAPRAVRQEHHRLGSHYSTTRTELPPHAQDHLGNDDQLPQKPSSMWVVPQCHSSTWTQAVRRILSLSLRICGSRSNLIATTRIARAHLDANSLKVSWTMLQFCRSVRIRERASIFNAGTSYLVNGACGWSKQSGGLEMNGPCQRVGISTERRVVAYRCRTSWTVRCPTCGLPLSSAVQNQFRPCRDRVEMPETYKHLSKALPGQLYELT